MRPRRLRLIRPRPLRTAGGFFAPDETPVTDRRYSRRYSGATAGRHTGLVLALGLMLAVAAWAAAFTAYSRPSPSSATTIQCDSVASAILSRPVNYCVA